MSLEKKGNALVPILYVNPYPAGTESDWPCYHYRARQACTSMQSDQALYCWLTIFKLSSFIPKMIMDSSKKVSWVIPLKKFGRLRVNCFGCCKYHILSTAQWAHQVLLNTECRIKNSVSCWSSFPNPYHASSLCKAARATLTRAWLIYSCDTVLHNQLEWYKLAEQHANYIRGKLWMHF